MIWLLACASPHDSGAQVERDEQVAVSHPHDLQPFDTLKVDALIVEHHPTLGTGELISGLVEPEFVSAAGAPVPVVARAGGWTAPGGLPDPAVLVAVIGAFDQRVELETPLSLEVGDVGRDVVPLEPGHTVALSHFESATPSLVEAFNRHWVRVVQVEAERVELQLIIQVDDSPACVVGQDWADWDGHVARWRMDQLNVQTDPDVDPVALGGLWLEIPFGRDGQVAGGGAGVLVDTRDVQANSPGLEPLCPQLRRIGAACTPCDDAAVQCFEPVLTNLRAEPSTEDLDGIGLCGPVLSDLPEPIEVDASEFGDCACTSLGGGVASGGLAWFALLLIRRRRSTRYSGVQRM